MGDFLHFLEFEEKNPQIFSRSLCFYLCNCFLVFLYYFGWNFSTISLVFRSGNKWVSVLHPFWVAFSLKGGILLIVGKSVRVN